MMISIVATLLAIVLGSAGNDPIPPPREKQAFRFTIHVNTLKGFEKAYQLTLEKDGRLYATNGRMVSDEQLGAYCLSNPDENDHKLVLVVGAPADISASELVVAIERIQKAANEGRSNLSLAVLTRTPTR